MQCLWWVSNQLHQITWLKANQHAQLAENTNWECKIQRKKVGISDDFSLNTLLYIHILLQDTMQCLWWVSNQLHQITWLKANQHAQLAENTNWECKIQRKKVGISDDFSLNTLLYIHILLQDTMQCPWWVSNQLHQITWLKACQHAQLAENTNWECKIQRKKVGISDDFSLNTLLYIHILLQDTMQCLWWVSNQLHQITWLKANQHAQLAENTNWECKIQRKKVGISDDFSLNTLLYIHILLQDTMQCLWWVSNQLHQITWLKANQHAQLAENTNWECKIQRKKVGISDDFSLNTLLYIHILLQDTMQCLWWVSNQLHQITWLKACQHAQLAENTNWECKIQRKKVGISDDFSLNTLLYIHILLQDTMQCLWWVSNQLHQITWLKANLHAQLAENTNWECKIQRGKKGSLLILDSILC